jgi:hypothetical protein
MSAPRGMRFAGVLEECGKIDFPTDSPTLSERHAFSSLARSAERHPWLARSAAPPPPQPSLPTILAARDRASSAAFSRIALMASSSASGVPVHVARSWATRTSIWVFSPRAIASSAAFLRIASTASSSSSRVPVHVAGCSEALLLQVLDGALLFLRRRQELCALTRDPLGDVLLDEPIVGVDAVGGGGCWALARLLVLGGARRATWCASSSCFRRATAAPSYRSSPLLISRSRLRRVHRTAAGSS